MSFNFFTRSMPMILALSASTLMAHAEPMAAPTPDPHPYQSQMMLRQTSGLIQTLPAFTTNYSLKIPGQVNPRMMMDSAMLYDIPNPFSGITTMGANWGFLKADDGDTLITIEAGGKLWSWGNKNYRAAVKGGVYFLKAGNFELVTVNSAANIFETGAVYGMPRIVGGNFFIDENNTLVYITSTGNYYSLSGSSNVAMVKRAGGNFMEKTDGSIMGVSSINAANDPKAVTLTFFKPDSPVKWLGGNYFIGEDSVLYTVDNKGMLKRNPDFTFTARPKIMAYSFIQAMDGSFVYVDGSGVPHNMMIRVWPSATKAMPVLQFNATLDNNSIYLPGFNR